MPTMKVVKPITPWNKRIAPRVAGKNRLTSPVTKLIAHKIHAARPVVYKIDKLTTLNQIRFQNFIIFELTQFSMYRSKMVLFSPILL